MIRPLRILALEAYDGGSHAQFLDGLIAHSRHRFTRISLPARKWKWRMRGAAIYFAQQLTDSDSYDLILTSDMTAVADLRALLPSGLSRKPIICYFHENQLTYPIPDESERDYQYGFTNLTSCLAADAVWFNSSYHLETFLAAAEKLLAKMPDHVPQGISQTIRSRAAVMPLGLDPRLFELRPPAERSPPPTVLWNHRWEYDKNPDEFFEALFDLQRAGLEFRLIVAGENFRTAPAIFAAAQKVLADRIDHFGYAPDRAAYLDLLTRADIIVSTAIHEFFGLAVLEAIAARCYPVLPDRLSYPELLPPAAHAPCLYTDSAELRSKLTHLLTAPLPPLPPTLPETISDLAWPNLIKGYDQAFDALMSS